MSSPGRCRRPRCLPFLIRQMPSEPPAFNPHHNSWCLSTGLTLHWYHPFSVKVLWCQNEHKYIPTVWVSWLANTLTSKPIFSTFLSCFVLFFSPSKSLPLASSAFVLILLRLGLTVSSLYWFYNDVQQFSKKKIKVLFFFLEWLSKFHYNIK